MRRRVQVTACSLNPKGKCCPPTTHGLGLRRVFPDYASEHDPRESAASCVRTRQKIVRDFPTAHFATGPDGCRLHLPKRPIEGCGRDVREPSGGAPDASV